MIRLAFMTDPARVIGATDPEANKARFDVLPPALHEVMPALYKAPNVVVGAPSLGPWAGPMGADSHVYVLSREPLMVDAAHVEVIHDVGPLIDRFAHSDEELLVVGGRTVFELFLDHADQIDVAVTDERVPGDVVFDRWDDGRFELDAETHWEGGRTRTYVRRTHLSNARDLYLKGIRDGHAEAIYTYTGARYTQHNTEVADGQEGFIVFFEEFVTRNPVRDIQLVRSFTDGRYVFLHAFQELTDRNGNKALWVTGDIFDTDSARKLIEHWDVITPYVAKTPSGHSNVDGATEITDLDKTAANKALVRAMIEQALAPGGDRARLADVVSDGLIEHSATPELQHAYQEVVLLVGRGNFVATLCRTTRDGVEYAQVDLFRLADGKVVEHWDAIEPVPPKDQWVNSGKF